ncbi:MAG: biopolymer transporter ExbD [Candidatus Omnitrophica bacterium]|nr:biopolymer transporter ExbD [Candidatus Omnitrophota bacterium]MCM8792981.1 biopolymer transporter ExbD [Candidatus Omnitrophota bacterium]
MRFRRHFEWERGQRGIDITPLVDVIFQLLIFFLLTSSFVVTQAGIKVNLPKAITSEAIPEETVVITVNKNSIVFLNDKVVTIKELGNYLENLPKKKSILLKADKQASLGKIVEIWDLCREKGIERLNIATVQEEK